MQQDRQKILNTEAIQSEYRRLDEKWMEMQFQANLWMVLAATAIEISMFFILYEIGAVSTARNRYVVKYLLAPFGANLIYLLAMDVVIRSKKLVTPQKLYAVSILTSLCCFTYYTIHSAFPALNLLFTIPVFVTVVYADGRLTTIVAALCLAEKTAADLLIVWDSSKSSVFTDKFSLMNFCLSIVLLAMFFALCLNLIRIEKKKNNVSIELEQERLRLREEAITDALTGVGNRQALREAFQEMEASRRTRYMLLMLDLDGFKRLNDGFGHACGDKYLQLLGKILRETCREAETPFRFGGDEFCVLLRAAAPERAEELCLEIQKKFQIEQEVLDGPPAATLSIGIADYRFGEPPFELLERADKALYQAKQKRGSICFFNQATSQN